MSNNNNTSNWTENRDADIEKKKKIKPMVVLQIIVSSITFICLLLNLLCLFAASWLHFDQSTGRFKDHHVYFGVARTCRIMFNKRKCYFRNDLFRFTYMTNRNGTYDTYANNMYLFKRLHSVFFIRMHFIRLFRMK